MRLPPEARGTRGGAARPGPPRGRVLGLAVAAVLLAPAVAAPQGLEAQLRRGLAARPAAPRPAALPPGGDTRPDRSYVAIPPAYPVPAGPFLPLPETRSAPVASARPAAPALPERVTVDGLLPRPPVASPPDRPAWEPARLAPVVGIDGRGRITSVLEHRPGRFAR